MKSVDKLRELADKLDEAAARMSEHGFSPIGLKTKIVCDEIEREIEEHYMPAPLDADGVPVKIGDKMVSHTGVVETVKVLKLDESHSWHYGKNAAFLFLTESSHHAKQRTLEDVLREMVEVTDQPLCEEDIKAFADEIRELMAGDAE